MNFGTAPTGVHGDGADARTCLCTTRAGQQDRRLAFAAIGVAVLLFVSLLPFARTPLAKIPAFIPSYESALAISNLITAVMLFGHFTRIRLRALSSSPVAICSPPLLSCRTP